MSPLVSLITALTLLVYLVLTINVVRARTKYKVSAPQMTGNLEFERVLRVQQNSLEQLVLFLPGLWLFSFLCQSIVGDGYWYGLVDGTNSLRLGILSIG